MRRDDGQNMATDGPRTLSCWEPSEGPASLDVGSQVVITAASAHVPCQGTMREVTEAVLQFKVVSFTQISRDFIPFTCFVPNREAVASKQVPCPYIWQLFTVTLKNRSSRLLNIHNI